MKHTITINGEEFGLESLEQYCWQLLSKGASQRNDAMQYMSFATAGDEGAAVRTVVLRAAQPAQHLLLFYTDKRSPKCEAIQTDERVAAVFYDDASKVQLAIKGYVTTHQHDEIAQLAWQQTSPASRNAYMTSQAPSSVQPASGSGLPQTLERNDQDDSHIEKARNNFLVIAIHVTALDFLLLAATGNSRAGFYYDRQGRLENTAWLTP